MFIINPYIYQREIQSPLFSNEVPDENYIPGGSERIHLALPIPNSGASGTTDWINPTSGVAENWNNLGGANITPSIVTGNGFAGNAQRVENAVATGGFLRSDNFSTEIGAEYRLKFKYRKDFTVNTNSIFIQNSTGTALLNIQLDDNALNAIEYDSVYFTAIGLSTRIQFWAGNSTIGDFIELDELLLIKK